MRNMYPIAITEPSEEGPGAVCTPGDDGNRGERERARRSKAVPEKAPRQAHLVMVAMRGTRAIERWAVEKPVMEARKPE